MDYKKKYKEALKRAKEWSETKNGYYMPKELCEEIFPELKESEDERIRKEILQSIRDNMVVIHKDKCISWLEKQEGCEYIKKDWLEHIKQSWYKEGFIDGKYSGGTSKEWTINDFAIFKEIIDFLENGTEKLQHDLTKYANWLKIQFTPIEKQCKQFSVDKLEPKFKVGDWVVTSTSSGEKVVQIDSIEHFKSGEPMYITSEGRWFGNGTKAHLWTIQDAKDGEVLYFNNDISGFHSIGLFKRLASKNEINGGTYRCYARYGGFNEESKLEIAQNNNELHHCGTKAYPATKEQRDALFAKMKEAGYEWDAEKKKLRLLITNGGDFFESENCEQKHAEWKQEKREELTEFENAMMHIGESFFGENAGLDPNDIDTIKEQAELLLELVPKQEWSEKDETKMRAALAFIKSEFPKKGDEEIMEGTIEWLKSLKERYTWKPSNEQIEALEHFVRSIGESGYASPYDNNTKLLYSLLEQLKKLKA